MIVNPCPYCGHIRTSRVEVNGRAVIPTPGDISVCFCCGFVGIYTDTLDVRFPTPVEGLALAADPAIERLKARVEQLRAEEGLS